jgi:endonuclease III-like uncharacterized protein
LTFFYLFIRQGLWFHTYFRLVFDHLFTTCQYSFEQAKQLSSFLIQVEVPWLEVFHALLNLSSKDFPQYALLAMPPAASTVARDTRERIISMEQCLL